MSTKKHEKRLRATKKSGYFADHINRNVKDKEAVAVHVVKELLFPGDSIALDAGSSATYLAEELFRSRADANLSILTHNMEVFTRFGIEGNAATTNQLILTGGEFDPKYNALFGIQTEEAYNDYHPRAVVIATSGLTETTPGSQGGLFCHAMVERKVKQILFLRPTSRRIVLADYTKLGTVDSHLFGELEQIVTNVDQVCIVTTEPPAGSNRIRSFERVVAGLEKLSNVKVVRVGPGDPESPGSRAD